MSQKATNNLLDNIIKGAKAVKLTLGIIIFISAALFFSNIKDVIGKSPPIMLEWSLFKPRYVPDWDPRERTVLDLINYFNSNLSGVEKNLIRRTIFTQAKELNLDPLLIAALIGTESSYRPGAVSPCAAKGLMQLGAAVRERMHTKDPFDIRENIIAGTEYLAFLTKKFNDTELILAAYNAGPTRVACLERVPDIRETRMYIKKVNRLYAMLWYWNQKYYTWVIPGQNLL